MIRKSVFLILFLIIPAGFCAAQGIGRSSELVPQGNQVQPGKLTIYQDPGVDSLINRYILYNERLGGFEGFRIQIYSSNNRNAREESGKARQEFISKFPGIESYALFEQPGYYKIRAGDFRSKAEGTKYLLTIRRVFPDAYLVPDIIKFPDPYKK